MQYEDIDQINNDNLTLTQFSVMKKIKDFLSNLHDWYKIEWNNIYINNIENFKKISEFINDENKPIIDWININILK